MDNHRLAELLMEMANLHHYLGDNAFKARAFKRAAIAVRAVPDEINTIAEAKKIAGVGPSIAAKIIELRATGKSTYLSELRRQVPADYHLLSQIPGLGVDKIKALQAAGIETLAALAAAIASGSLSKVRGFGPKLQLSLQAGLEHVQRYRAQMLGFKAQAFAAELAKQLAGAIVVGEVRRQLPVVSCLELIATGSLAACREALGPVSGLLEQAHQLSYQTEIDPDSTADLAAADLRHRVVIYRRDAPHKAVLQLLERTGPAPFWEWLVARLPSGWEEQNWPDEAAVMAAAGLPLVPPELRDNLDVIERLVGKPECVLVTESQIRGCFHVHTDRSDGHDTLAQVLGEAQVRQYQYIGIADHSQTAVYANGLSVEALWEQAAEIKSLRASFPGLRIFHGVESDIRRDGTLDYPDDVLAQLDFVVASIHNRHGMFGEPMTARIVRALEQEQTTMLGHPIGRLLLRRESYQVDIRRIIDAAAANGKAIEINANPRRLDLDFRHHDYARNKGVVLFINTDAHNLPSFDFLRWGVGVARKGGLQAADIGNTWSVEQLEHYFGCGKADR